MKEHRRFARHLAAVGRLARLGATATEDHAAAVAARVDSEETWSRLQAALVALDDTGREMLLMVAGEGLSYGEMPRRSEFPWERCDPGSTGPGPDFDLSSARRPHQAATSRYGR